jgi:alkyl sulfatase BDS1-like metallo-beta-lactamase superfamily hydrolase
VARRRREVWGHEYLDRNRNTSSGISVLSGIYQARAAAQFGVFHPRSGPDAFPNQLGFTPEKLLAGSSYQPPTQLFPNGRVVDLVVAGEPVQVAPARSDTSDSVGFYFPRKRMIVINFMVPGGIFNVYTLRGGRIAIRRCSSRTRAGSSRRTPRSCSTSTARR